MCVCERGYLITGWLLLGGRELRSQSVFEAQMGECQNVSIYKSENADYIINGLQILKF